MAVSWQRQPQYNWRRIKGLYLAYATGHHATVGDQVPFRTIGPTSSDFWNHLALNVFGKWTNMVHFPSRGNSLVSVPPIKAAITKRGFIWILLIAPTRGQCKMRVNQAFPWKNDPRNALTEVPKDVSVKSWATTRSLRNCVTTQTGSVLFLCRSWFSASESLLSSSLSDLMKHFASERRDLCFFFAGSFCLRRVALPSFGSHHTACCTVRKCLMSKDATTSFLQGKHGVEICLVSVNKGNSPSWVRISHGLNKVVTDMRNKDDNEQQTSEMQLEDFALKSSVLAFASRSKAKAKPRRRTLASSSTKTVPIGERKWTDIEPETFVYRLPSVKTTEYSSLWSSSSRRRCSDWILEIKRLSSVPIRAFSTLVWWNVAECNVKKAEGTRKDYNIVLIHQDNKFFITTGQCVNSGHFFEYICHMGCAINWHSITNWGLIPGGQNLSKRQTVFASCMVPAEEVEENIKTRCTRSIYNLLRRKDLCSIKLDRTQSSFTTLPAYGFPKAILMETGAIMYEKVNASPRPPPTMSYKDYWMCDLDSDTAGGSEDSQQNQPRSKTQWLSTVRLVKSCVPVSVERLGERQTQTKT